MYADAFEKEVFQNNHGEIDFKWQLKQTNVKVLKLVNEHKISSETEATKIIIHITLGKGYHVHLHLIWGDSSNYHRSLMGLKNA